METGSMNAKNMHYNPSEHSLIDLIRIGREPARGNSLIEAASLKLCKQASCLKKDSIPFFDLET